MPVPEETPYRDYPRAPRRGFPGWPLAVLIFLVLLVIYVYFPSGDNRALLDPDAMPRKIEARGDLAADEQATIELFQATAPSAVFITTSTLGRDFFNFNLYEIPQGTGSGVVWDKAGHIVTNFHVVEGASRLQVTLADQSTWDAELVGAAPDKDIAVLKIDAPQDRLAAIAVGSSADLQVGQKVFAIGNPFGLDQTLTTGVISGLSRQIRARTGRIIEGVIQTDAAINPGNSGGPLLDSAGRLIGVNTAIYSPSGAFAGIGFAIPVDIVNRFVPDLLRYGRIVRPDLEIYPAPEGFLQQRGLEGVLVTGFPRGSAAEQAGMQGFRYDQDGGIIPGDIIVAVESQEVTSEDDLYRILEDYDVGDIVEVTVIRNPLRSDQRQVKLSIELQPLE